MFKTFIALLLALPVISALQLNQPTTQVYSSSPVTVTWTTVAGDPGTFDLYLTNSIFRNNFALSNSVKSSDQNITLTLPSVPIGSGYTFQASNIANISSVLSQTGMFDIAQPLSTTSSFSSTSSGTGNPSSVSGLSTNPGSSLTPLTGTSSSTSSTTVPSGSFNGNGNSGSNGALGVTGICATAVGVLVAAGAFFAS